MPQDAGLVFEDSDVSCDFCLFFVDDGSRSVVGGLIELLELNESGEAPVLLIVVEAVVCLCSSMSPDTVALRVRLLFR